MIVIIEAIKFFSGRQSSGVGWQEDCEVGPGVGQVQAANVQDERRSGQECCQTKGSQDLEAKETIREPKRGIEESSK